MSTDLPSSETRRPWHEGETAARLLAGKPQIAPVIRPFMTEQLRGFFPLLPLVVVTGLDASGRPVASLLCGEPGFVASQDPWRLDIAATLPSCDPLAGSLAPDSPFGLIGVDFLARRRNRANGRIIDATPGRLSVQVSEAFGNCPKYIAPRQLLSPPAGSSPGFWRAADRTETGELITHTESFFIATRGPDGVDISHRGGRPGFVRQAPDGSLTIPDYRGNNYFNTFGNLLHNPAAALLFVDFVAGKALHLSGEAQIDFSGAERFWRFTPQAARILHAGAPYGGAALTLPPEAP